MIYERAQEAFKKLEGKLVLRLNNLDLNSPKGIEQNYTLPMIGRNSKEVFITEYVTNCKICHNWLKNMANCVFISKKGNIISPWERIETDGLDAEDKAFIEEMMKRTKKAKKDPQLSVAFISDGKTILTMAENYAIKVLPNGVEKEFKFQHFHCSSALEKQLKSITPTKASGINGLHKKIYNTLTNYPEEVVVLALELAETTIYRGKEQVNKLKALLEALKDMGHKNPYLYAWTLLSKPEVAIYNTALGTLLDDLNTKSVDEAVASFEAKMYNYKRTTKVATPRMKKEALKTIKELGYEASLGRRMAKLQDISPNDVLWLNHNAQSATMVGNSLEEMFGVTDTPTFDNKNAVETTAEDFVKSVLPETTNMWVGNNPATQFALVAPKDKEAKSLTAWDNNFSWAYLSGGEDANIFDTRTKELGGKTNSYFRATLLWNDEDTPNTSDMDLHIGFDDRQYGGVYFGNMNKNGFTLDVDVIHPAGVAIENITANVADFNNNTFTVSVHTFNKRSPANGLKLQIKIGEEYRYYHFDNIVERNKYYPILKFENGTIVKEYMQPIGTVANIALEKVTAVLNSPNYWEEGGNSKGNKHLMFAIDGFTPEDKFMGIIPEHLHSDLQKHRRVFETISDKLIVEPTENAVAGVGKGYTNSKVIIPVVVKTNKGYISYKLV